VEAQRPENRWCIKDPDLDLLLTDKSGLTAEQALEWLDKYDPSKLPEAL
jgi:hypothetical protein